MRARRTCRINFLEGGLRLRFNFFSPERTEGVAVGVDATEARGDSGRGALLEAEGEYGPGVEDLDLTRDRSIQGFSGGS